MKFKVVFSVVKKFSSRNIRVPNYLFFNKEFKFLVKDFHTQFLKESMFKAQSKEQKIPTTASKDKCNALALHTNASVSTDAVINLLT